MTFRRRQQVWHALLIKFHHDSSRFVSFLLFPLALLHFHANISNIMTCCNLHSEYRTIWLRIAPYVLLSDCLLNPPVLFCSQPFDHNLCMTCIYYGPSVTSWIRHQDWVVYLITVACLARWAVNTTKYYHHRMNYCHSSMILLDSLFFFAASRYSLATTSYCGSKLTLLILVGSGYAEPCIYALATSATSLRLSNAVG